MNKSNDIEYVYTPYITLKNGKKIWAKRYGKKVFCFPRTSKKNDSK